ncbi:MAG: IS110 family transposase [Bacillota bacterium]|nr:IS110 family transposase [Bacillota bacterium]
MCYSVARIQAICWWEVAETIFAGVDWADDHHDCVVLDSNARLLDQFRVRHTASGLVEMTDRLKSTAGGGQVGCILEVRHGILVNTLLEAGFDVYPVNPKTVNRHRVASGAKTDAIDAFILARHGLHEIDRLRRLEPDSAVVKELKILTRDQASLIQEQTRLVNQLTACLKEYYPVALQFFGSLAAPIALAFLKAFPTPEQVKAADQQQLSEFLRVLRHPHAALAAQKIFQLAQQPQLTADPITTRAKARMMLAKVSQLAPLLETISSYDKEQERLFLSHSDSVIFRSIPGAGKRLAPRLLAEWGDDRSRYACCESVAALAGTSPVPFQSGHYKRAHKRYACVRQFRNALYHLAWQSTLHEPWAKEYYLRKRAEGKSHSVALRALSNVWVRVIHKMWMTRTCYCRETFLNSRMQHKRAA